MAASASASRKTARSSVNLTEELHTRVQALADANHVSAAWIIRTAVVRFLEDYGDQTQLPLRLPQPKTKGIGV